MKIGYLWYITFKKIANAILKRTDKITKNELKK